MINIENLTQITRFQPDEKSHIVLDREICRTCESHACVQACPAKCYSLNETSKRLEAVYENCLECGTCYVICDKKAVDWTYPRGGFGVVYRLT
jgi:ferredoxin like protein